MKQDTIKESAPKSNRDFPWSVLILCITVIVLAGIAFAFFTKLGRGIKDTITGGGQISNPIVVTIDSYLPEVISTNGDILELTFRNEKEYFKRESVKKAAWDKIYLGTTVSEIKVDATFRYHLKLSDPWKLAVKDNVCKVLAPPIHPTTPVAINTSSMERSTSSGWALFDKDANLEELMKSISPALNERASDPKHMGLARDKCRESVGQFVRNFLLKKDYWRADGINAIVVVFPDEANIESLEELEKYVREPIQKLN
jgi:hypothetical protein